MDYFVFVFVVFYCYVRVSCTLIAPLLQHTHVFAYAILSSPLLAFLSLSFCLSRRDRDRKSMTLSLCRRAVYINRAVSTSFSGPT